MIGARARDVGQAHKLGGYLGYLESSRLGVRSGLGALLLLAGIFFPVPAIRSLAVPGGPLGLLAHAGMICAGIAAFAAGIALIATAGHQNSDWIFVYDNGVAQVIRGGAALSIIPWARFGHVVKKYYYPEEDGPYVVTIRITGTDGTVISADTGYGHELSQLERHIDMVVTAMRLRGAVEQCRAGVPVVFGRLSVSRDGIGWDKIGWDVRAGYAAWPDIRSIHVSPHSVVLGTSTRKKHQRLAEVRVDGIPDWCVAVRLIQNLADHLAIPQQGTAAVLPSGARHANTMLYEADVAQVLGRPVQQAVAGPGLDCDRAEFQSGGVTVRMSVAHGEPRVAFPGWLSGHALAGLGDAAWLVPAIPDQPARLVMRVGRTSAVLSVTGLPPPEQAATLIRLAKIAEARLAQPPGT